MKRYTHRCGDVVDLDPPLDKQFLDLAIGEPEPHLPAHCDNDHLGREPEPDER